MPLSANGSTYTLLPPPSGLPNSKPNLVMFMPDQLRYDALSCSGNEYVKTPNIDSFAAQSTRFTNVFLQATVCSQSRCSIFTGSYPHISGHRSLDNLIKPWEPNLFRSLKEAGYHVAILAPRGDTFAPEATELAVHEYGFLETPEFMPKFVGNKDLAVSNDIWDRLFYKGVRGPEMAVDYDEAAVRSAVKWLECPPEEPWVLFLPLIFPHCPFQVEEPYFSMYDRKQMPAPTMPAEKTGYEPRYMEAIRKQYGTSRATPEIWAEVSATYHGMISRLDDQFGRVLTKLKEDQRLWDRTVTMFFTDHGEYLGDHGLIEKWPSGLSDSLCHEPLIIGGGGLPQGKVSDVMGEMVDLVPTVFQLCGIPENFPHNGKSLIPTIMEGKEHKEFAYTEGGFLLSEEPLLEQAPYPYDIKAALQHQDTSLVGKAIAIRNKEWTYIYRLYEPAELYNRQNDPDELHNLAAEPEYTPICYFLQSQMFRWSISDSDFLPYEKDPRFPRVSLTSPADQLLERKEKKAKENVNGPSKMVNGVSKIWNGIPKIVNGDLNATGIEVD